MEACIATGTTLPMRFIGASEASMRRVLVVEDDVDLAEALMDLLTSMGNDVVASRSGRDACLMASQYDPDVVFCDLGLPDIDGFATARAIRAHPVSRRARLVALTGDPHALREATEVHAFDCELIKPVGSAALEKALAE